MRFSIRGSKVQATLVFLEIAVIPVAILLTFFVLLGGAGIAAGVRTLDGVFGLGAGAISILVDASVVLAALLLVSMGALAVDGYRLYVDRYVRRPRPLPMVVVPLVGAVGALGYGATQFGVTEIPWWLFVIVAVFANTLAFRLITVYSFLHRRPRSAYLAGVFAAVPAMVALTRFVDANLLEGASDEIARSLLAALAATPIPEQRWLLVVGPLIVAGAYIARQLVTDTDNSTHRWTDGSDDPSGSTGLATSIRGRISTRISAVHPGSIGNSVSGAMPSVSRPRPLVRLRKLTDRSSKPGVGSVDAAGSLGAATAGRSAPPPQSGRAKRTAQVPASSSSSPSSSPSSTIDDSEDTTSESSSERVDRSASSDVSRASDGWNRSTESAAESSTGTDRTRKSTSSSESAAVSSKQSADGTHTESSASAPARSSTDPNSESTSDSTGQSQNASSAESSRSESSSERKSHSSARSETSGSGSDTRIFTDDFGTYGATASPVEICPDCEEDIPSDGVYKFCPFCGSGL